MAYAMTKRGSQDNIITYEFICDTLADMNAIENKYRTLGTIAIVLGDGLEVYIANSNREWNSLSTINAGDTSAGSLSIYICGNNEVDQGLPDIDEPDETTIYLVPAGETSGNLYEEYIWVDDAWEKFGAASIDLSNYATKQEIPTIPANVSAFTNDAGYLTSHQDISGKANSADLATVATSGSYTDLSNKPTIPDVSGFYTKPSEGIPAADLADTYLTSHQDISGLAPKASPVFTGSISLGRKANTTIGHNSIAIGSNITASGDFSYAEGLNTIASGAMSHAEGQGTAASNESSHAEGQNTTASGSQSHAEGNNTTASGSYSHAEGANTTSSGYQSHAEGNTTIASGTQSHAEGDHTIAYGVAAHAEGMGGTFTLNNTEYTPSAQGVADHVEGYQCLTTSNQPGNHAEGYQTRATGGAAHSEGNLTIASGNASHAEGNRTTASNAHSHAEGVLTTASGRQSHAEGEQTIATGACSHVEGYFTHATADASHVGGKYNIVDDYTNWEEWVASTSYSVGDKVKRTTGTVNDPVVTGYICKTANSDASFTSSKWNIDTLINYAHIIGNGTDNARSNAYALDWEGNGHFSGDVYVGCNNDSTSGSKLATESFVTTRVPTPPVADGTYILRCVVSSGTATYSWVAISDLSGVTF